MQVGRIRGSTRKNVCVCCLPRNEIVATYFLYSSVKDKEKSDKKTVPEDIHGASRARRVARPLRHWVRHVCGIRGVLDLELEHARVELRRLRRPGDGRRKSACTFGGSVGYRTRK